MFLHLQYPPARHGKSGGFSFLEVIIVLFLVGIIAGFSLPNFIRLATSSVELQASRTGTLLRDLQALSILTGKDIRLVIDSDAGEMRVLSLNEELEWVPHEKYGDPIAMTDGVTIKSVRSGSDIQTARALNVNIRPSGFTDIFSVEFYDDTNTLKFRTEGVLGNILTGEVSDSVRGL